jgi:hypothetical protein
VSIPALEVKSANEITYLECFQDRRFHESQGHRFEAITNVARGFDVNHPASHMLYGRSPITQRLARIPR